jgi:CBS domain-containing protein
MAGAVRDVMTPDCQCVSESDDLVQVAKRMAELDVGAMPICGSDDRLKGMITDRDIVVKALAQGRDPASTQAGELAEGKPVTVGADDSIDSAMAKMAEHQVRRLPVIDDQKMLCGIVAQADLARNAEEARVGETVEAISAD